MSTGNTTSARVTPLRETWRQLMASARSRAPHLRASLIGLGLAAAVQGLALACLMPLFRALIPVADWQSAWPWLLAMTALMLASTLLRWWAQGFDYCGDMVQNTHELRSALGQQLRRIPLERLQDKRAGEVHATLLGSVDENLSYLLTVAGLMAHALITPLVVALAALYFDWRLGLLLLALFPLLIPLYRWRRPAYGRGLRMLADANARTGADILEYTQGLPVLRAACCTGAKAERLQAGFAHLQAIQTIGQKKGAKPNLILATVMELGILLVVFLGTLLVLQGSLEVAVLAALLVIVVRFAEPLATFVLYAKVIDLIEAALGKIDALLSIAPLPQQAPTGEPAHFEVNFVDVSFAYAGSERPTLRDFSAVLPAHGLTALVGPSGAGKSTVARLLMRHADPQAGRILIGGVNIRSLPPERLNALVSVVFQDVYLFDDSILANIRMARPEASDEEVEAAARAAHCHTFIQRLPEGYRTRVGDIGGRLSGGERQRISIARAILKDAPIVILDEPTAALDTESEVAVQAAIDTLVRERTVIVIAHRLSTIAAADQILVIDDGQVLETGRHAELLARAGRYARMWQAQQRAKDWHVGA
ncbi:ABC transporter ATP-binding protein [Stutzerimonas kirkiae]|uniref:ABC transporter ATP-binding protein/permease n=1 Tax=Stutzerimonas kirkiae TaxID=2211392 RepID=A0A4Q9RFR5_9GAMM|nr:ABC transporter ATP-binding protein [Stutzerimonas kirkiae]TBU99872.1 ABC transporter ATP-binding protein/permease [Stutzerimonas kirkiae]TBV05196.1 ABC transporter ATP-binding protein/permease [Stutzerimonas kirkiae]TBV08099.1 ABC transporter ATP-binding protein/permease [Stutzerimonas kirkiae]TBV17555.1 ABC transporter ATP-binding protein/permease [Stutzerimonas kirkiae]